MSKENLSPARAIIFLGSINAFFAIVLGAFGAHELKSTLSPEMFAIYQTAFDYHIIHSIGLILVGIMAEWMVQSRFLIWAGGLFFAGIVLFSGSLYVLAMTKISYFGILTPMGGLSFLAGWMVLTFTALRKS